MEHKIYVKYSNERSRLFALRTEILEDENQQRSIRKTAIYPEGEAHIRNLYQWYQKLSEQYRNSPLSVNRCELEKNAVRFEYVEGETLEWILDRMLASEKVQEAAELLKKYLIMVAAVREEKSFSATPAFERVFGAVGLPEGLDCVAVADIDLVCSNILVQNDTYVMIDYEWTFDFPVPVHFLLYRILHYFLEAGSRRKERLEAYRLYEWVGITAEEMACYAEMERKLQAYITKGHTPIRELYQEISPGSYHLEKMLKKEQLRRSMEVCRMFFSSDGQFCEENSVVLPMVRGSVNATVAIPKGTTCLRIDPGEGIGRCSIESLRYDTGDAARTELSHGMVRSGDEYEILLADPQILIRDVPEGASKLQIKMKIQVIDAGISDGAENIQRGIRKLFERISELEARTAAEQAELAEQDRIRRSLEEQLADANRKIQCMENTKVWKAYRKYRDLRERN